MKITPEEKAYYEGTKAPSDADAGRRKRGPTPQEQARSRCLWRDDSSKWRARLNEDTAAVAILQHTGREPLKSLFNHRRQLGGLLNTERAWTARRAWVCEVMKTHREYRRAARRRGERAFRFMVVVVPAQFRSPEGHLAELDIAWVRATALRWTNGLPAGTLVNGIIEVVLAVDPDAKPTRAWAPHLNLIVELVAESREAARQAIKDAFSPAKINKEAGIHVPVKAVRVWWLRGAGRYLSKGLQLHRIGQRKPYLDSSGKRRTRKDPLAAKNRLELILWLQTIEARHLILPSKTI